jgi:hypothetical protein
MFFDLPPGKRVVLLEYVPHAFSFGLVIALVGLLAPVLFGGLWLLRRRGIVGRSASD